MWVCVHVGGGGRLEKKAPSTPPPPLPQRLPKNYYTYPAIPKRNTDVPQLNNIHTNIYIK